MEGAPGRPRRAGPPPHRPGLGRPADPQERPQPLGGLAPWRRSTDLDGRHLRRRCRRGRRQTQVGGYFGRAPLVNLGPEIDDFADTMAIIDGLDLVVTVDTAIGHLAGAMGKPVSIMLPFAPDWRWLETRADTPWYPTVRLFRPPRPATGRP